MPERQQETGKKILVVEDDYLLARQLSRELKRRGVSVLGPAPTVHYARLIVGKRRIDGAVLDIRLFGEEVYGLVDTLLGRGVPIIFATGRNREEIAERYRAIDTVHKPICFDKLMEKVQALTPLPVPPAERPRPKTARSAADMPGRAIDIYDRWSNVMLGAMCYTARSKGRA